MEDLSPEEIWHWYNKRCNVENKIDELKTGVGIEQTSQNEMLRNMAFMWIKILSYNLLNWFRLALLPASASSYEIPTIRRVILNVPGNVVGNGRYRHVRLVANQWLQQVADNIKNKLKEENGSPSPRYSYLTSFFKAFSIASQASFRRKLLNCLSHGVLYNALRFSNRTGSEQFRQCAVQYISVG